MLRVSSELELHMLGSTPDLMTQNEDVRFYGRTYISYILVRTKCGNAASGTLFGTLFVNNVLGRCLGTLFENVVLEHDVGHCFERGFGTRFGMLF